MTLSLSLSSCQTINSEFSDTLSLLEENKIRERSEYREFPLDFETNNMLSLRTGVFYVFSKDEAPIDLRSIISENIYKKIEETQFFRTILDEDKANKMLQNDLDLYLSKGVYLDSLASVSVSDKDISNPLGKRLEIEQLLVFQMDLWPCSSCIASNIMRMKLRLVDLASGAVIWTGIHELSNIDASNDSASLAIELSTSLVDAFFHRFKKKWHKVRFSNLKKANI